MNEIEKAAREQLMLWSGEIDFLVHQRADISKCLTETLDNISDPLLKQAFHQILSFVYVTERISGIQNLHSSLEHLLQYHNGVEGKHGYH